jgi:Arc/MetJ family transcription regulator
MPNVVGAFAASFHVVGLSGKVERFHSQLPASSSGRSAPSALAAACVWLRKPYSDGILVCMKKTLHIDEHLLREARNASGAKSDTDTVRLGLEALVRHAAYQRLSALRGSEPRAREVRRRRERTSAGGHSAA